MVDDGALRGIDATDFPRGILPAKPERNPVEGNPVEGQIHPFRITTMTTSTRYAPGHPEPQAIVVRTPNWLGDLLVSTSFLRALLSRFPGARVDLIVRQGFQTLPLPHRGEVIPYDKHSVAPGTFGRAIGARGYSHFFVLPPSFSSAWMAFRSGVPVRVGHGGQGRRLLLRPAVPLRQAPRSVHLVREYLDLLSPWMEAEWEKFPPRLEASDDWIGSHLPPALVGLSGYVAVAPGAEYGPAKQWPAAHYREIALSLAEMGHTVVTVGLPSERELGAAIVKGLDGGINLCGETSLPALVAAVARAALLISNDSGAMHLAAALGVPQIAIFGSTNPTWTAPLNTKAHILYRREPCSPCYARICPLGHTRCLQNLAPTEVIAVAGRMLHGD